MVRLTDHPHMTLDVYRGRKTTMQQQQPIDLGTKHLRYETHLLATADKGGEYFAIFK